MTDQVHSLRGSWDQEKWEDVKELHNGGPEGKFEEGQERAVVLCFVFK